MKLFLTTTLSALLLSSPLLAATSDEIYMLWDEFSVNENLDDEAAFGALKQILNKEPDNLRALKSAIYLKLRQDKTEEALFYTDKLLLVSPDDEGFRLQKAYLLHQLGRNDEALVIFDSLKDAQDHVIAESACAASKNLSTGGASRLKRPFFADMYTSPSYESRSGAAIVPLKVRAGRYYNDDKGQIYGFTTFNRDTKSSGGERPEIIDENALIVGVGINHRFGSKLPVTTYAEVGGSYDLIDRGRTKLRQFVVVGAATYKEWGDNRAVCKAGCVYPMSFHADFYGNVAAYSRNDYNIVADLRYRPGFNIAKSPLGITKAYWKFKSVHDTDGQFYNNVFETGPGISFTFHKHVPIAIRFESVKAYYLGDKAPNGDSGFKNNRIEITYYKSF